MQLFAAGSIAKEVRLNSCIIISLPVNADGHQIENGRRAAGNVHGDVEIANNVQ